MRVRYLIILVFFPLADRHYAYDLRDCWEGLFLPLLGEQLLGFMRSYARPMISSMKLSKLELSYEPENIRKNVRACHLAYFVAHWNTNALLSDCSAPIVRTPCHLLSSPVLLETSPGAPN